MNSSCHPIIGSECFFFDGKNVCPLSHYTGFASEIHGNSLLESKIHHGMHRGGSNTRRLVKEFALTFQFLLKLFPWSPAFVFLKYSRKFVLYVALSGHFRFPGRKISPWWVYPVI